jgi:hypothetical protein
LKSGDAKQAFNSQSHTSITRFVLTFFAVSAFVFSSAFLIIRSRPDLLIFSFAPEKRTITEFSLSGMNFPGLRFTYCSQRLFY